MLQFYYSDTVLKAKMLEALTKTGKVIAVIESEGDALDSGQIVTRGLSKSEAETILRNIK